MTALPRLLRGGLRRHALPPRWPPAKGGFTGSWHLFDRPQGRAGPGTQGLNDSRRRVRIESWGVLSFCQTHRFVPQFVHLTDGCLKLRRSRARERQDMLEASGKLFGLFRESVDCLQSSLVAEIILCIESKQGLSEHESYFRQAAGCVEYVASKRKSLRVQKGKFRDPKRIADHPALKRRWINFALRHFPGGFHAVKKVSFPQKKRIRMR